MSLSFGFHLISIALIVTAFDTESVDFPQISHHSCGLSGFISFDGLFFQVSQLLIISCKYTVVIFPKLSAI